MTEFEKIYQTYFDDVYLYIRRLSGDENIAEEITSEAFFKAMRSISGFRGDCDIRVWLCQVAKNCYYIYLKKSKQTDSIDDVKLSELPSEEIVTLEQLGDNGILLTFDKDVTAFDYTVYDDPDGGDFCYCEIQAWTSLWDKWFSQEKEIRSVAVTTRHTKPVVVIYVPNNGSENVCIAKYDPNTENPIEKHMDYMNMVVLPRLSLGYYLILAAAVLAALGIVWLLIRKKAEVRVWIERIGLYPAAYIISHCIVSGINWASYSFPRDLFLIVFISMLLYSGLLLAHNVLRLKKEIG